MRFDPSTFDCLHSSNTINQEFHVRRNEAENLDVIANLCRKILFVLFRFVLFLHNQKNEAI